MASGETLLVFTPQAAEFPSSNFGTPDTRNAHPVVDLGTGESVMFSGVLPRHYDGGGITVYLHYAMTSATTNNIAWSSAFERIGDSQQDIDSDGFATAVTSADITVPATSGHVDIVNNAHTDGAQIDSVAVGDGFRLKITRATPSGSDASGDLELRFVELKET